MTTSPAITLRPVQAADFPLLRRLNSPVWRRIQLGLKEQQHADNPTLFSATEACELVYQFSNPIPVVEAILKQGRAHFRFVAARAISVNDEAEGRELISKIQADIVGWLNRFGRPE